VSRSLRATIEPMTANQWLVSGPWAELIVERNESQPEAQWLVRHKKSEPGVGIARYTRFERGLSDAYSRAMGFTR
jgi:hypothetical protein